MTKSSNFSPADLDVGDVVLVRPGASIPADGKIVDGAAEVDESMVTGESRTVRRERGDQRVLLLYNHCRLRGVHRPVSVCAVTRVLGEWVVQRIEHR